MSVERLSCRLLAATLASAFLLAGFARAGTILYVDGANPNPGDGTSWSASFRHLQDALASVRSGGTVSEIHVAQGRYKPDEGAGQSHRDTLATFQLASNLTIAGGYAGTQGVNPDARDLVRFETVLSGDLAGNDQPIPIRELPNHLSRADNSISVVTLPNSVSGAVLEGFTITSGNATAQAFSSLSGGGLTVGNGSVIVRECRFTSNSAEHGGAISTGSAISLMLQGCTFLQNSARYNGGAVYVSYTSNCTITNCRFLGNNAGYNAGAISTGYSPANPKLVNCLFSGNSCYYSGGAIWASQNGQASLLNCTFTSNSAAQDGGAIANLSAVATNCIVWGNHAAAAPNLSAVTGTWTYSCVQGGMAGAGNIETDPLFIDADGLDNVVGSPDDDVRLRPGSPCVDAGFNTPAGGLPAADLDGNPRIGGEAVDLGAFEGARQALVLNVQTIDVAENGTAQFSVCLAKDPAATVSVSVTRFSGDTDLSVASGTAVTFDSTNYSVPQVITVQAADDSDWWNGQAVLRVSGTDLPASDVIARELDDDASPPIVFVKQGNDGVHGRSWADAFGSLQDALIALASLPAPVGEIWVAAGTYRPDIGGSLKAGDRHATFGLVNGVSLRGGFAGSENAAAFDTGLRDFVAHETILSGDLAGNDAKGPGWTGENSYHVVTAAHVGASTMLDGFTITGGYGDGPAWRDDTDRGGGLLAATGTPTIVNCHFRGNYATQGGAIYSGVTGTFGVRDCTFTHNTAGSGGALRSAAAALAIDNCDFLENSGSGTGGAVNFNAEAPCHLNSCRFRGNLARSGGAMSCAGTVINLTNCIFAGNTATGDLNYGGGAIAGYSGELALTNCTVYANYAPYSGPAFYSTGSEARWSLTNCIVWGNICPRESQKFSWMTASYCCLEAAHPGVGNLVADPRFLDPLGADKKEGTADDDLRLRADSPCIDAGNNAAVPASVLTDFDGQPRFVDDPATLDTGSGTPPMVDMGVYEGAYLGYVVSPDPVAVPERQTATFTIALAADPLMPIEVSLAKVSGDANLQLIGPASLMFDSSNFRQPQTVTLSATADGDHENGKALVRISAAGVPDYYVLAREVDLLPPLFVDRNAQGANDGSSWVNAFTSLQDALGVAAADPRLKQIWVAGGTYKPDLGLAQTPKDRTASFQAVPRLALLGGFAGNEDWASFDGTTRDVNAHPTVLSGDLNGDDGPNFTNINDNSAHVLTAAAADDTALIEGFTITGGNANISAWPTAYNGGGLYISSATAPTVRRCKFIRNCAYQFGGAIYGSIKPALIDCVIEENRASYGGSGIYASYANLQNCLLRNNLGTALELLGGTTSVSVIRGCVFEKNTVRGISANGGTLNVADCRFSGHGKVPNASGALYVRDATGVFINCSFQGNFGGSGAAAYTLTSNLDFINCAFAGNSANYSGAIYDSGSTLDFVNCVLAGNRAFETAGGLNLNNTTATLTNTILWANRDKNGTAQSSQITSTRACVVNYSCVQGWTGSLGGVNNQGVDPLFLRMPNDGGDGWGIGNNDDFGDLRLDHQSLCIDAGNNEAMPSDVLDLDNDGDTTEPTPYDLRHNARFLDNPASPDIGNGSPRVVDMGPYEYGADDYDGDGISNVGDNCPLNYNPHQEDIDSDGFGDLCDADLDGDGTANEQDNCPSASNSGQEDFDSDHIGDACDNCPQHENSAQADMDADGMGDSCDPDRDGDNFPDESDNCPSLVNPGQEDADADGVGDHCDACPDTPPGMRVDANGCLNPIPGDFDHDFDVDQEDFGLLQACLTGPLVSQTDPLCAGARLDDDADVDTYDILIFQNCFGGPDAPVDPACRTR